MACGFLNNFKFSKKFKFTYTTRTRCKCSQRPDYADEATEAESSSDEGEDTGPESSNDETPIGSRFQ